MELCDGGEDAGQYTLFTKELLVTRELLVTKELLAASAITEARSWSMPAV
jgi:hypothetical protein